jgi:hypothetical protein
MIDPSYFSAALLTVVLFKTFVWFQRKSAGMISTYPASWTESKLGFFRAGQRAILLVTILSWIFTFYLIYADPHPLFHRNMLSQNVAWWLVGVLVLSCIWVEVTRPTDWSKIGLRLGYIAIQTIVALLFYILLFMFHAGV